MNRTSANQTAVSALTIFLLWNCSVGTLWAGDAPKGGSGLAIPVYRSQVSEVQITFSATDQNHHAIATLSASDFAVVDKDIVVRTFRGFSRAQYTRLELAVVVDNSGSVAPRFEQVAAEVASLLSQTSGVPEASVSIISFRGIQPALICKDNCGSANPASLVPAGSPGGLTPLFDSLKLAADSFSENSDGHIRKAVILFSDGEDTISRASSNEAIAAMVANDVQVYSVSIGRNAASSGAAFLEKLSSLTGGRSFQLNNGAQTVADAVLDDFHASYQVTYRLPYPSTGFHAVRILPTHNLNLTFRCRQGYFDSADSH